MRKFGLIGYPLKHSFSKLYFEKKFTSLKLMMPPIIISN